MSSFHNVIEFTEIVLESPLPLNPYLVDHSCLSLRLIVDENPCSETPVVHGDRETGRWVINSRFHVPQESDYFKLAAIVNVGELKIQLLAIDHAVSKVTEHVQERPEGYHKFSICEPGSPLQLTMICKITLSSSPNSSSFPYVKERHRLDASWRRKSDEKLSSDGKNSAISSREYLVPFFMKAAKLQDSDRKFSELNQAARTYYELYRETNDEADLEKAISIHEEAVRLTSVLHPNFTDHLKDIGDALKTQFEHNGDPAIIEKAISHYEKALSASDDSDRIKASHLSNLGIALHLRFEWLGGLVDLESAIAVHQRAIRITPDSHPGKPSRLNNLGNSLVCRFERLGNLTDLESAIKIRKRTVKIIPDGHPDKPFHLNNIGVSLSNRFERLGNLIDLDQAIKIHQKAVEITPDGHPSKSVVLVSLAKSLSRRFEQLGSLIDLENAIAAHQKAVEITPKNHPSRPFRLNNLGISLICRFERLSNVTDLDSAISAYQKAVEIIPEDSPDKANLLGNLGNSLTSRFERLGNLIDLDRAVELHQKAVKITPDDHRNKPSLLNGLGISLTARFERLNSLTDLDDAIKIHQKAVEIAPDGHPGNSGLLNRLGVSLNTYFERLGNLTDVDRAISVHQKAVKITPDGHPNKQNLLINLGASYLCRFQQLGNPNDLEDALQSYSQAAHSSVGSSRRRFQAARSWAKILNQHSRSPLPAFQCAINLLPRITLQVTDQRVLLADIGYLVRDAVTAAITFEEYETAVEWVEEGRSIVWQNLLNPRTPLDNLRVFNSGLANRLQDIAQQLESPVPRGIGSDKTPATPMEDVALRYSRLGAEWDMLVEEVRQIPKFEGFLKAKSFTQLAPAACEGPVIILNVHQSRSDALVLIPDNSSDLGVSVVNIPLQSCVSVLSHTLFKSMNCWLSSTALRSLSRHRERIQSLDEHEVDFSEILGLLWSAVVKPVLDGLAISAESEDPRSRVWWCATGPLSFLPVHAAGIYGTEENGHIISDYVVSSYTPTLTALLDQPQPIVQENFQMLTVAAAQSLIPETVPIPGAEEEVKLVHNLAKSMGVHCVNLTKESATVRCVLQEMVESNWIHLACHGQRHIKDSMESGFLLYDRILPLSEIVKLSLPKADFAYLSACMTAKGDEKIAEESVHLAAGMLLPGCRGVIATMWLLHDADAPKVAELVYRDILKDGKPNRKRAAYALDNAVKGLRESGADFVSWVPFIHIGR